MKVSINHNFAKTGIYLFLFLCAVMYILLFSKTLSPLYSIEESDSSVFKVMGQVVLHGKMPYVDIFDHKGPMLYLIEAFGQWLIPGRIGLFLLAIIALYISIICWYQSARLFTSAIKSIIVVILTLLTYYFYSAYSSGNLTEDWNVLFVSVSYYLLLSLLIREEAKSYLIHGGIIGICFACAFFIRPNDAVAFIGAPILGELVWMLKNMRDGRCIRWIEGLAIGFITVSLVFIIWFASHKALNDLWYGLIGFNAKYTSGIIALLEGGLKITKLAYVPFLACLLILAWQSSNRRILYMLIPTIISAYVLLGNNGYLHYWIIWIPVLFFTYWLLAITQENKAFTILSFCIFLSLPIFNARNWLKTPITMVNEIKRDINTCDTAILSTKALFENIVDEDRDSIWSYNLTWGANEPNTFNVLLYNNIIPCNRVPLIFMADIDTTLRAYTDITKYAPKYVLFSSQNYYPWSYETKDSIFLNERYSMVGICDQPQLILFKRNSDTK